jgi:O-antigen/teichoic acid export membrane protein
VSGSATSVVERPRQTTRSMFFSSTGWSAVAQIGVKLTTAGTAVLLALLLRPAQLGQATAATSLGLIFGVIYDAGFSTAVVRQLSSRAWGPGWTLTAALAWRRRALLPVAAATLAAAALSPHLGGPGLAPAVLVYALAASFASLGAALLNGVHRFRAATLFVVFGRGLGCASLGVDLATHRPTSPAVTVLLLTLGEIVTAVGTFASFRRGVALAAVTGGHEAAGAEGDAIRTALPFALSTFFTLVYNRADVYIVTVFAGTQVAGLYAPASQLQNALMVLPGIAGAAIIPVGARLLSEHDRVGTAWLLGASMRLSIALTIPVTAVLWVALPHFLSGLLGHSYAGSAGPARLLLFSLPLLAVEIPLVSILTAASPKSASTVYGIGLIVCVAAHALLDRQFGPTGAAFAALSREPAMLLGAVLALRRVHHTSATAAKHAAPVSA